MGTGKNILGKATGQGRIVPAVALGLLALVCAGAPALAQLSDDATSSTLGTQFVGSEDPNKEQPKQDPPPATQPPPVQAALTPPKVAEPARYPSVVFLVDTSDSMLNKVPGDGRTRLDQAKSALTRVLQGMSNDTRVQVWIFNTNLYPIQVKRVRRGAFISIGEGSNREELVTRVEGFRTDGGTNLYRSIIKALDLFADRRDQAAYVSGERFPVLVVLSDGEDGGKTREDLNAVLKRRAELPLVSITTIGFQVRQDENWFRTLCTIATRPDRCATAGDEEALHRMLESFYRPPGN